MTLPNQEPSFLTHTLRLICVGVNPLVLLFSVCLFIERVRWRRADRNAAVELRARLFTETENSDADGFTMDDELACTLTRTL